MSLNNSILILGHGNTLRRDDALGPLIVEEIERRGLDGIRTITRFQLTPELAADLVEVDAAIFVDASADPGASEVVVEQVSPLDNPAGSLAHAITPAFLLGLARATYGRHPRAWIVAVPARELGFGEGLSPIARIGMEEALHTIEALIPIAREPGGNCAVSELSHPAEPDRTHPH